MQLPPVLKARSSTDQDMQCGSNAMLGAANEIRTQFGLNLVLQVHLV